MDLDIALDNAGSRTGEENCDQGVKGLQLEIQEELNRRGGKCFLMASPASEVLLPALSVLFCVYFCCVLPLSCIQFSKLKNIFVQVNHRLVETSVVSVDSLAAD